MPATRNVVLNLADHQRESGIVTRGELDLAKRWWREIVPGDDRAGQSDGWLDGWLGTRLPFSFRYGGQDSSEIMKRETLQECSGVSEDGALAREFKWQDADTGLAVTWHVKRFEAYPAVEWVLEFENQGDRDTPVIENVQALDLWLDQPTEGQPYTHPRCPGRAQQARRPDAVLVAGSVPRLSAERTCTTGRRCPLKQRAPALLQRGNSRQTGGDGRDWLVRHLVSRLQGRWERAERVGRA